MVSEVDEGKGLVKVYWQDVRDRVAKVEPTFAKLVDEVSPDRTFPLYLAYYPYGVMKGDTISTFIPDDQGGFYRLNDSNLPKDIAKNLGYGAQSAPLAMLLEKTLELFVDLKKYAITMPKTIYKPGDFFPFGRILSRQNNRIYAPNCVLATSSGARSVFMLPSIGCFTNHDNLKRDYNIKQAPPKSLYEHWFVFRQIINSKVVNCDWRSCLLYFSEKWLSHIENDSAWQKLRLYFHEIGWQQTEYRRNYLYYDLVFSIIQKSRNLKPNPYLVDTARHLFAIGLGETPGYAPVVDDEVLPMRIIQKAFVESYGLKKYIPTIMAPKHFNFEQDRESIYYSLQHPSTLIFSPKSRKISSTLTEMRELEHVVKIFNEELTKKHELCYGTVICALSESVEFSYFHNKVDRHGVIQFSDAIFEKDNRFKNNTIHKLEDATFASDATFLRGCIGVKVKN